MSDFLQGTPPLNFDRAAYGAWRQTVDNARDLAAAERFVLPPPPRPTLLDALERANWLNQQQFNSTSTPFGGPQGTEVQTLPYRFPSPGKVWEKITPVVKVLYKVGNRLRQGKLIYDFLAERYG